MSREVWTGEILKAASDLTLGWVRPKYRKMNGPCDPTAFDSYAARLDYHVNILRFACDELTDFRLEWHANYYTNRPLGSGQQFSIGIYEAMEKISDLPQPPW